MQKYCRECGKTIKENDKFCGKCGAEIIEKITDETPTESEDIYPTSNLLPRLGGSILLCACGLGFLFGVLIVVHGLFGQTWMWYIESLEFFDFKPVDNILFTLWGIIMIALSVIVVMGGLDAIEHENWKIAIMGGIFGLFLIGPYFILTILSACGLILVSLSKAEFHS